MSAPASHLRLGPTPPLVGMAGLRNSLLVRNHGLARLLVASFISTTGDRLHQMDVRFSKTVRLRGSRIQGMVDVYNLFNANPVLAQNNAFGAAWQRPLQMLQGRIVKFGAQLNF